MVTSSGAFFEGVSEYFTTLRFVKQGEAGRFNRLRNDACQNTPVLTVDDFQGDEYPSLSSFPVGNMRSKRALPKNPCSIAAVASLLHGSSMVESSFTASRSGSQNRKGSTLQGMFEGRTYTMGWWTTKQEMVERERSTSDSSDTLAGSSAAERMSPGTAHADDVNNVGIQNPKRQGRRLMSTS